MALTKKDTPFIWSTAYERSFEKLKKSFISVPILHHFNPGREIVLKTDASNIIIVGVLSLYDTDDILHLVAYVSKKQSPAEINYKIYDKELFTIIWAFKE
jgi:hypothetical protein